MSNKKAVVKIGADVEEAKKGIDSISSQVDDPPKIAGRYTKGAECSAGWLRWNSV